MLSSTRGERRHNERGFTGSAGDCETGGDFPLLRRADTVTLCNLCIYESSQLRERERETDQELIFLPVTYV